MRPCFSKNIKRKGCCSTALYINCKPLTAFISAVPIRLPHSFRRTRARRQHNSKAEQQFKAFAGPVTHVESGRMCGKRGFFTRNKAIWRRGTENIVSFIFLCCKSVMICDASVPLVSCRWEQDSGDICILSTDRKRCCVRKDTCVSAFRRR